jgi:hypothetical protein
MDILWTNDGAAHSGAISNAGKSSDRTNTALNVVAATSSYPLAFPSAAIAAMLDPC